MLAEEEIDQGRRAESIRGAVYYHRQDAERFAEGSDFYIGYALSIQSSTAILALPTEVVGCRSWGCSGSTASGPSGTETATSAPRCWSPP
jgi:hypothetical protein